MQAVVWQCFQFGPPLLTHPVNRGNVDLPEPDRHSFIVRVWLEETAEEADHATWRGLVKHVPTGEHRYVGHLDEISFFINKYLEEMGIEPELGLE